jgi:hypothetical protein
MDPVSGCPGVPPRRSREGLQNIQILFQFGQQIRVAQHQWIQLHLEGGYEGDYTQGGKGHHVQARDERPGRRSTQSTTIITTETFMPQLYHKGIALNKEMNAVGQRVIAQYQRQEDKVVAQARANGYKGTIEERRAAASKLGQDSFTTAMLDSVKAISAAQGSSNTPSYSLETLQKGLQALEQDCPCRLRLR